MLGAGRLRKRVSPLTLALSPRVGRGWGEGAKLATEAPVNGGRNYEPFVVVKFGYMLEHLSIRRYSPTEISILKFEISDWQ